MNKTHSLPVVESIKLLEKNKMKKQKCCICKKEFKGYGNNPYPVKEFGRCCDKCNKNKVIPERIRRIKR